MHDTEVATPSKGVRLSKHRMEGLSDGVFAIVMTLLVLELKPPELPKGTSDAALLEKLLELGPAFFTFVMTFLLAGLYWFLHHSSFQFVKHMTRAMVWFNLGFLMFVSLLPFSAALFGHFLRSSVAAEFYYGNQFMIGVFLIANWMYAKKKDLLADDLDPIHEHRLTWRLWMIPLGCLAAIGVSIVEPKYSSWGFLSILLVWRIISRFKERSVQA